MAVPVLTAARARALLAVALAACAGNHRVSPFPDPDAVVLTPPDDLAAQLARIAGETSRAGLTQTSERACTLRDRGPCVVLGFAGKDALGRPTTATRVATPAGVVLALGPAEATDRARGTELVASLTEGAYASGTDLDGDGAPEVVVRDPRGVLSVWRIERLGASPVPVDSEWPATLAFDADGDGHADLAGRADVTGLAADPLAPALIDLATADAGRWSSAAAGARAWQASERDAADLRVALALRPRVDAGGEADGGPPRFAAEARTAAARAALERAFHAIRAGDPPQGARAALDATIAKVAPLPAEAQAAYVRWRVIVDRTVGP